MGYGGNTVATLPKPDALPGYRLREGRVPVLHAPGSAEQAREFQRYLERGVEVLSTTLATEPPELTAMLVADQDWEAAPRENEHPYPMGLPYFTRSVAPPALVLPERLSPVFQPRTMATLPLTVWHELAHAFLLQREVVRTPVWLGEFLPQTAAAVVARRMNIPLEDHLKLVDQHPGFSVRGFEARRSTGDQMAFQNLLLALGAAALDAFGAGFLRDLVHALWEENDVVDGRRAERLLATALGPRGSEWLRSRSEF